MAIADVNWMLSSAVQSGAALVAIVGGLLGSRYVTLHGEQQAAERRLNDVRHRLPQARAAYDAAAQEYIDFRVADVLDDDRCYEAISQSADVPPLDDVLNAADASERGIPRDALEQHLRLLSSELKHAAETLLELVPESEDHLPWETFRRAYKLKPGHEGVWEWCYVELVQARGDEARARRKAQRSREASLFEAAAIDIPRFNPVISTASVISNSAAYNSKRNRLINARDETSRAVDQLEAEEAAAEAHLRDAGQPEGFGLALAVLSYLGLVSIAVPVGLMIAGPLTLPLWLRITVAVLFLSGVALLMRYLFVYASYLDRTAGRQSLPRSPLGLLKRHRQ